MTNYRRCQLIATRLHKQGIERTPADVESLAKQAFMIRCPKHPPNNLASFMRTATFDETNYLMIVAECDREKTDER